MDTSMTSRMKELEDESRRLKKMYLEEKLKAEIANACCAPYVARRWTSKQSLKEPKRAHQHGA